MKLKEYLATAQEHGDIVAFRYSFNSPAEDGDIEDFSIGDRTLRLEDLMFSTDAEGNVIDGAFVFEYESDTDGIPQRDTASIKPLY